VGDTIFILAAQGAIVAELSVINDDERRVLASKQQPVQEQSLAADEHSPLTGAPKPYANLRGSRQLGTLVPGWQEQDANRSDFLVLAEIIVTGWAMAPGVSSAYRGKLKASLNPYTLIIGSDHR
jgi:hypothetical protein